MFWFPPVWDFLAVNLLYFEFDAKVKVIIILVFQEKRCGTVSVEVRKSQHKYVIGPKGSNLSEILGETGVSVEVPRLDENSDTITLRGDQDKLARALSIVYDKVWMSDGTQGLCTLKFCP